MDLNNANTEAIFNPNVLMRSTWSPLWPQYLGVFSTILALVLGIGRYILYDTQDVNHCNALLSKGSWLDSSFTNWQPQGCMLNGYKPKDAATCLNKRSVVFIGDSVTRKIFYQTARTLDPSLPSAPPDDHQKRVDHSFTTSYGSDISFHWDPFLNTSQTLSLLESKGDGSLNTSRPAMLVLGSGLWNLRYAETSGGISHWEASMDRVFQQLYANPNMPSELVVVLPVSDVVESKLSMERAATIKSPDIHAMNSDLFHRIHPSSSRVLTSFPPVLAFPSVFNDMLEPSQTEDGLHFSDAVVKAQASILLNLRCNEHMPKKFPFDKTCCRSYPWPSLLQSLVLIALVAWGPYVWLSQSSGMPSLATLKDEHVTMLVVGAAVLLMYLADRTGLWLKEQKSFSPWTFAFLSIVSLAIGLVTVRRAEKDLGFLNRDQTDEWKGWMQVAVLIYHYLGASKISGIYNPIRVLVASFLFMTGYGHTTYYIRKADFGLLRIAQVLVRLNLLTLVLAYTMNTDYLSYYFSPLVSLWFIVIYLTMAIGWQFNDRTGLLIGKILVSGGLVTAFFRHQWLLENLFQILERVFAIHWSAKEWSFRVTLDLWIVYIGMLTALAVIKIREARLNEHRRWPLAKRATLIGSTLILIWYFVFELFQESKFTYNAWHPYIAFLPVLTFAILRNANVILRSASSKAFIFIGRCSLEAFIMQFHLWLAADTKGVLLVLPATRWRPINFLITTTMFIFLCHHVALATGQITAWICENEPKALPQPVTTSSNTQNPAEPEAGKETTPLPVTTPRWAERLSAGTEKPVLVEWPKPGLPVKLGVILGTMWALNVLWTY